MRRIGAVVGRDPFEMAGKTALVTGAAKRIGRATALAMAAAGVNVAIHYHRSAAAAEELAGAVRALGPRAWTLSADLADANSAETLFAQAVEAAGPIDILINNASISPGDDLLSLTPEALQTNVQIHAWAPLVLSRQLAAQGRDGAIVNFLDARIVDHDSKHVAYHLSKRMLFSLTRMMALEFAPAVRVNAVAPGLILPPEGEDERYLERLASTNPLERYGSLEAITGAVMFLLRSEFITGQVLFVDGGRHLRGNAYG